MSDAQRSAPVWAIHDGHAGNARQAMALARALGWPAPAEPPLQPRAPWRWLAPRCLPGAARGLGTDFARALARPPRLAIGCGRQAALATRVARSHGATAVQILDPRLDPRHWDQVIVPEHDGLRGDNVLTLLGSLHPVDEAWLAEGRQAFPRFGQLPGPRVALLVGGPTERVPWEPDAWIEEVRALVFAMAQHGGSLLVTTSRRTPSRAIWQLRQHARPFASAFWTGAPTDGPNPYAGMLGWADVIACTADSSNLLSEACATSAPVVPLAAACARGRALRLLDALQARGRLSALRDAFPARPMPPLRETERIAAALAARIAVPVA